MAVVVSVEGVLFDLSWQRRGRFPPFSFFQMADSIIADPAVDGVTLDLVQTSVAHVLRLQEVHACVVGCA